MQEKRCSFSVVVLDNKIYAIGGHSGPEHVESVEQYCPTENSWRYSEIDFYFSKCQSLCLLEIIYELTFYTLGSIYMII